MSVEQPNEIVQVIESTGLEVPKAKILKDIFGTFYDKAKEWEAQAKTLVVTDASQTDKMALARDARLAIREVRIAAEKARKSAKEESLKEGKAIDKIGNFIKDLIEPIEAHLDEQEHFVERQKEARKDVLEKDRTAKLSPFVQDLTVYDLREMTDQAFDQLLQGFVAGAEAKKKADKEAADKAEADRIEAKRIKDENDKLKEENHLKDLEIQKQKDEEIARKKKADDDEKARLKAEADKKAEEDEAKRKAESAPDREKLAAFADSLESTNYPQGLSADGQKVIDGVREEIAVLVFHLREKAQSL